MSLLSLKKHNQVSEQPSYRSVDEFIDEAEAYAQGLDVHHQNQAVEALLQRLASVRQPANQSPKRKRATFCLTQELASELNELAESDGMNKSQLIRRFINFFAKLPPEQRFQLYQWMTHCD